MTADHTYRQKQKLLAMRAASYVGRVSLDLALLLAMEANSMLESGASLGWIFSWMEKETRSPRTPA